MLCTMKSVNTGNFRFMPFTRRSVFFSSVSLFLYSGHALETQSINIYYH